MREAGTGKSVLTPPPGQEPDAPAEIKPNPAPPAPDKPKPRKADDDKLERYYELKTRIHRKLVEQLDLAAMSNDDPTIRDQVADVILELCEKENALLNYNERQKLVNCFGERVAPSTFARRPIHGVVVLCKRNLRPFAVDL